MVGKNDDSRGTYNVNSQIEFKTFMLKSCLCDYYSDACIIVKEIKVVPNKAAASPDANNNGKKVILKYRAPFTDCIK